MFTVDNSTRHHINVTGGPLSYKYQFQEIHIHYGMHDNGGSEHSINGYAFPAEVCASSDSAFPKYEAQMNVVLAPNIVLPESNVPQNILRPQL
jgi:hypothetical protein